jgi:hypothetical protein
MEWIDLAQGTENTWVVNTLTNILFPQNAGNFLTIGGNISFCRSILPRGVFFFLSGIYNPYEF